MSLAGSLKEAKITYRKGYSMMMQRRNIKMTLKISNIRSGTPILILLFAILLYLLTTSWFR